MSRIRPFLSWVFASVLCLSPFALAEGYDRDPSWDQPYDDPDHDWDHDGDHDWDHGDGDHDWDHPYEHPDHECADYGPSDSSHPQEKLAAKFGVSEQRIARLRGKGLRYGEIDHTLTLAERMPGGINRENVNEILYMRQEQGMGWGQIAKAEGTTLGRAKQEFPTQPPVEPEPKPAATTDPTSTAQTSTGQASTKHVSTEQTSTAQPKSLSRSGKSSYAGTGNSSSAKGFGGKSSISRGGSSNRSVRTATASSSAARSGGHAYGRGSSSGGSIGKANGKSNGKAKGLK